jgi:hypothetical protein
MRETRELDDLSVLALRAADSPALARRLERCEELLRFASTRHSLACPRTPLPCGRRHRGRPCSGELYVQRQSPPEAYSYYCSLCGREGLLIGFADSPALLQETPLQGGPDVEFELQLEQFQALRALTLYAPEWRQAIYAASFMVEGPILLTLDSDEVNPLATLCLEQSRAPAQRPRAKILRELGILLGAHFLEPINYVEIPPPDGHLIRLLAQALAPRVGRKPRKLEIASSETPLAVTSRQRTSRQRTSRQRTSRQKASRTEAPAAVATSFELRIQLQDTKPPIWRRLRVPSDILLDELHAAIQTTMGWFDEESHMLHAGNLNFLAEDKEHAEDPLGFDSREVRLSSVLAKPGDKLIYLYDFGDVWMHEVTLESIQPVSPSAAPRFECLDGALAARPNPAVAPRPSRRSSRSWPSPRIAVTTRSSTGSRPRAKPTTTPSTSTSQRSTSSSPRSLVAEVDR